MAVGDPSRSGSAQRLRKNCMSEGSFRQCRVGAGIGRNEDAANIRALVSRSTSAYTLVVSIET